VKKSTQNVFFITVCVKNSGTIGS